MSHYFMNDDKIKSKRKNIIVKIENKEYNFLTDNGVFSKDKFDTGSRILVETILETDLSGDILDLGSGYGPIGIILNDFYNQHVTMVEVNERAIELAKENVKNNNCKDCAVISHRDYQNSKKKYKYIITNPPIRVGKEYLYEFLLGSKKHLKDDGELWFVIRKNHGAKSLIYDLAYEFNFKIITKKKGFFVIKGIKNLI